MDNANVILKKENDIIKVCFPEELFISSSIDFTKWNLNFECYTDGLKGSDVKLIITQRKKVLQLHFPGDVCFLKGFDLTGDLLGNGIDIIAYSPGFHYR